MTRGPYLKRGQVRPITDEQRRVMHEMCAARQTVRDIARALGVGTATVHLHCRRMGLTPVHPRDRAVTLARMPWDSRRQ